MKRQCQPEAGSKAELFEERCFNNALKMKRCDRDAKEQGHVQQPAW